MAGGKHLADETIAAILTDARTYRQIAGTFGLSIDAVIDIRNGHTYRHVHPELSRGRRPRSKTSVRDRLLSRSHENTATGCRVWDGACRKGYGVLRIDGQTRRAHVEAYRAFVGPIPSGMDVCHRCDYPPCIKPDHLFLGDRADNMRDCVEKDRQARGERHARAKLTDEQARAIREDRRSGVVIAKEYAVSQATVSEIRNRRHWTHL